MPELNAWWIFGALLAVAVGLWWCLDAVKEVPLPRREESHDVDADPMLFVEPPQWDHI